MPTEKYLSGDRARNRKAFDVNRIIKDQARWRSMINNATRQGRAGQCWNTFLETIRIYICIVEDFGGWGGWTKINARATEKNTLKL